MTRYASAIAERLHEAAERIPVDTDPGRLVEPTPTSASSSVVVTRRPRRWVVAAAAAAVLGAAAAAFVVVGRPGDDGAGTVEVDPAAGPTAPGSFAPHLASPPDWFGEPRSAEADGLRSGRWTSMAIGQVSASGDSITEPIVISAFDGGYGPLARAETVTIDGTSVRSLRIEGWQTLAVRGTPLAVPRTPTVMVSGRVGQDTLAAVLAAVEATGPSGDVALRLSTLPLGYTEIVPPQPLGPGPALQRVLVSEAGDVGISDQSDYADPLLFAAWTGEDLTRVDLDGTPGWTAVSEGPFGGALRSLVWSPRPGAVFEINTDDPHRPAADLADLALATTPLPVDDWDALYAD